MKNDSAKKALAKDILLNEKSLYFYTGIIGAISLLVGVVLLLAADFISFAFTLLIVGFLEVLFVYFRYLNYTKTIENRLSKFDVSGESETENFIKEEKTLTKKALRSFLIVKIVYGFLAVFCGVLIYFFETNSIIYGISLALLIHFVIAIIIDFFAENSTRKYFQALSDFTIAPKIQMIVPINFTELVIQFEDSIFRHFPPSKDRITETHSFLAFPNKIKSYTYNEDTITWFNETSFHRNVLFDNSNAVDIDFVQNASLRINMKNQAPTSEHKTHHVYSVSIFPFNSEKTFALSESIHGGFGDTGGAFTLSIKEMLERDDWQDWFEKSDCAWAIDLVNKFHNEPPKLINLIVKEVCRRSNPT